MRTTALCADGHAVRAHLLREPGLLDVAVVKDLLLEGGHYLDLRMLENRRRAHLAESAVDGKVHFVLWCFAAAVGGEAACNYVVCIRLETRRG